MGLFSQRMSGYRGFCGTKDFRSSVLQSMEPQMLSKKSHTTSFFIILFSEIAEHFGLSLLDRKYLETDSQDGAFQPEIPTPPSYSLPTIGTASPTQCTQTLPFLSRFK